MLEFVDKIYQRSQRPRARAVRCTDLLSGFLLRISRLVLDLASAKHTCLSWAACRNRSVTAIRLISTFIS